MTETRKHRVLIIGYGNPLRGDDGIGYHIATLLQERTWDIPKTDVQVIACLQLLPELSAELQDIDRLIFIDAHQATEQCPPGHVACWHIQPDFSTPHTLLHHLHPATLLGWTQMIYDAVPEAVVVAISSNHFGYNDTLSDTVQQAIPEVLRHICALCRT